MRKSREADVTGSTAVAKKRGGRVKRGQVPTPSRVLPGYPDVGHISVDRGVAANRIGSCRTCGSSASANLNIGTRSGVIIIAYCEEHLGWIIADAVKISGKRGRARV